MRTSISLLDTGTLVFNKATADRTAGKGTWTSAGRYLGWAALGVLLAVAVDALLTASADATRFQILAALAAGLGLTQVWRGFDGGRALIGAAAGLAVIILATASVPAAANLLAGAYLIAGVTAAASHRRETALWVPTAALSLTLAVLSLA